MATPNPHEETCKQCGAEPGEEHSLECPNYQGERPDMNPPEIPEEDRGAPCR